MINIFFFIRNKLRQLVLPTEKSRISCWKFNWMDLFDSDDSYSAEKKKNGNSTILDLRLFYLVALLNSHFILYSFGKKKNSDSFSYTKHFPLFKHVSIFVPLDIWSVNWVHIRCCMLKNHRRQPKRVRGKCIHFWISAITIVQRASIFSNSEWS